VGAQIIDGPA